MHKEEKCGFIENTISGLFLEIRKVLATHGQFLVSAIISKVLCVSTYYKSISGTWTIISKVLCVSTYYVVAFDCEWILIHAKSSYQSQPSFCGAGRGNARMYSFWAIPNRELRFAFASNDLYRVSGIRSRLLNDLCH